MKLKLFLTAINWAITGAISYMAVCNVMPDIAGNLRIGWAIYHSIHIAISIFATTLIFIGFCVASNSSDNESIKQIKRIPESLNKGMFLKFINMAIQTPAFAVICAIYGFWYIFCLEMICVVLYIFTAFLKQAITDLEPKDTP